jgi:hypothetical protein
MIKAAKKSGSNLNITKALYNKPITNIILTGEIFKVFSLKSGMRQGCLFISLLSNIALEFLARAIRQDKEVKGIHLGKEEVEFSLFADDVILCLRGPTDTTKRLLDLISTFSKVAEYKINT